MELPRICYFPENDILVLDHNEPHYMGETIAPQLWVSYNRNNDAVASVTIDFAANLLQPYLFPADGQQCRRNGVGHEDLEIRYTPETDTLELQTGQPPFVKKTVLPGIYVNFDAEGWAMGVIIERAAERLRPYIGPDAGAGIPKPATAGADAAAGAD